MRLSFRKLAERNLERCEKDFHTLEAWSITDWACALGGETGECLNEVKKLRRHIPADMPPKTITGKASAMPACAQKLQAIGEELADIVIYADLLAQRLGLDLGTCVVKKFNRTSKEIVSDVVL